MSLAGHYSPTGMALGLMGMSRFVPREYVKEAAPPYFTNYIAVHLLALLAREAALWPTPSPTGRSRCRRSWPAAAA
jgi:hypothetical protein